MDGAAITTHRLQSERAFHHAQTVQRAVHFASHPNDWLVNDDTYLDHETWIRPAMDSLGDVAGLNVLDYGCGHGMASIVLARRGALVTAFDLAAGYVHETYVRAVANGVTCRVHTFEAAAERLPFTDASFDAVWGNAILHHLDLSMALPELRRVVKPGGRAVFCEPWGGNPLLEFARRRLPYPGKDRSADEKPLRAGDVALVRRWFPSVQLRPCQLLAMVRRLTGSGRLTSGLHALDERLFRACPSVGRFSRYVVLSFRREPTL